MKMFTKISKKVEIFGKFIQKMLKILRGYFFDLHKYSSNQYIYP